MDDPDSQMFFSLSNDSGIESPSLRHVALLSAVPDVQGRLGTISIPVTQRAKEPGGSQEGGSHGLGMEMVKLQVHGHTQVQSGLQMQTTLLQKKKK